MEAADKQDWDPSVKALTQFPSVLDNMVKNLAWTSALGEASYYQQKDVMAAIQRLRKQAKTAGNLKSGQQIVVQQPDPQTIVIQPASPTVAYVPVYNPTVVYGVPYYPPYYSTSAVATSAIISFGVGIMGGIAISNNSCCRWGWHYGGWGCGWRGGTGVYHRSVYVSHSPVYRGGYRGGYYGTPPPTPYNSRPSTLPANTGGNRPSTLPANPSGSRQAWRNSNGQGPEMQSGPLRRTAASSVPRPAQIRELSRDTTRAAMCAPRLIGDAPAPAVRPRALALRLHAIQPPAPRPPRRSNWHCGRLVNGRTVARRQR